MTTLLPMPSQETEADDATDATPGCGCCIPPPGGSADKARAIAELQARREALERRLQGLQPAD